MKVVIYNSKGGVGKSPIAVALTEYLENAIVVSNEQSDAYLDNYEFYKYAADPLEYVQSLDHNGDVVYDFGGRFSHHVIDAVKSADVLIVPTYRDVDAIQKALNAIEELREYGTPVIAVATKTPPGGDQYIADTIFDNFGEEVPVFHLREGKVFMNALATGQRPNEYVRSGNPLLRTTYRNILGEIEELAEAVKLFGGD